MEFDFHLGFTGWLSLPMIASLAEFRKKIVWCQRKEQFTVEMNNSLGELRYLRGTLEERLYTTNSPQTVAEIAQMIKSHNVPKSQL